MNKEVWKIKFSNALRSKMDNKNMIMSDLAARAGLSYENVYRYYHGESIPTAYTVNILASVLDCTTDELINFDIYGD